MKRLLSTLALILSLLAPALRANPYEQMVTLDVLPGWRLADGSHMAAVRFKLADGWKTYWRAPGDAGVPPHFDWSGSRNLAAVQPEWPVPVVFSQNGMRSIGYKRELVLPLRITPQAPGQPVRLRARMQIGICDQICVPVDLAFDLETGTGTRPDPVIIAALADRPVSAPEAGVHDLACAIDLATKGLTLTATLRMPRAGQVEAVVIETADPEVWVAEADLTRAGDTLTAQSHMMHAEGGAFAVDRSGLRLTVLGRGQAVDIRGCPAP